MLNRPTTGVGDLDRVLGGLSWGDNVVWEHDSASPPDAFFAAIHGQAGVYDHAAYVTVHADPAQIAERYPDFGLIDARPGTAINQPGRLLAAVQQACVPGRNLMVFDPLEAMGDQWGEDIAVRFFVRCCPALLSIGAIAYWSLSLEGRVGRLRRDLEDVTQCVLVLRDGRLQIAKAEGRPVSVQGSVYRCRIVDGMPELEHAQQQLGSVRRFARCVDGAASPTRAGGPRRRHAQCDLAGRTRSSWALAGHRARPRHLPEYHTR